MALGERQGRSQLSAIFSLSENVRALFFLGRTGASPTAALKGRAKVKRQPHLLHCLVRHPDDCCPENGTYGGQGKAVGLLH
jgi:hypothetical protein